MCTTTPADAARTPDRTATMTNNKTATRRMGFCALPSAFVQQPCVILVKAESASVNRWKFARKADYLNTG
jgi:hypothetical protein